MGKKNSKTPPEEQPETQSGTKQATEITTAKIALFGTIITAVVSILVVFIQHSLDSKKDSSQPSSMETEGANVSISAIPSVIYYMEDPDQGTKYWTEGNQNDGNVDMTYSFVNHIYELQITSQNGASTGVTSVLPEFSDFDLETILRLEGSSNIRYGINFRMNNNGMYSFDFIGDGRYRFYKWSWTEEKSTMLVDWAKSPKFNVGGENKLRVVAIGDKIRIYINDQDVLGRDIIDSSYTDGKVGLGVTLDGGESGKIYMSEFTVKVIPTQ